MDQLHTKYEHLKEELRALGSVAVGFSSGVDSTFLLQTAVDVLGKENVLAVTAVSCSFPKRERDEAAEYCRQKGIRHLMVESEELEIEGFRHNPKNRCYLCKKELFEKILKLAADHGIAYVAEGSNMDDNGDYRPGLMAVKELGIQSPLRKAELYKSEIRELSKELGLPTWEKQSFACLSSRFPYGETISEAKLGMVDRAEQLLLDLGFRQLRVRIHGTIARIEIMPDQFELLLREDIRKTVYDRLKEYGFTYVTMDLMGYRTGSMNETLKEEEKNSFKTV